MNDAIKFYRSIQILEKYLNASLMTRVVPSIIFCIPGIQIVEQYVCIKFRTALPLMGFLVFPLMATNAITNNILALTMASWVHSASQNALTSLNRKATGMLTMLKSGLLNEQKNTKFWKMILFYFL